jgi:hypothetical protein
MTTISGLPNTGDDVRGETLDALGGFSLDHVGVIEQVAGDVVAGPGQGNASPGHRPDRSAPGRVGRRSTVITRGMAGAPRGSAPAIPRSRRSPGSRTTLHQRTISPFWAEWPHLIPWVETTQLRSAICRVLSLRRGASPRRRVLDVPPNDDHGPGSRHPRCRRAAGRQVDARHRQHDDEAGATKGPPAVGRPVVVRETVRDRFVVTVTMRVERRSGATRTDHFRSAVW